MRQSCLATLLGVTGRTELKQYDAYLRGKAEPQVRELLTGYGPVALIWVDTSRMMTPERGQRFADLVRSPQPNARKLYLTFSRPRAADSSSRPCRTR
jgi:hypothetical protein